jgi:hypothetical protein
MAQPGADERRSLRFDTVSEIMPEVERLRASHRTLAKWSLAQICKHLADSVNGSIDGFDLRRHRIKRFFFRRLLLAYTLRYGIPRNYLVDPGIEPVNDSALDDGVSQLRQAIQRYQSHNGPLQAHPLFGRMPRHTWDRIQCIHCAHHLSFVLPCGQ